MLKKIERVTIIDKKTGDKYHLRWKQTKEMKESYERAKKMVENGETYPSLTDEELEEASERAKKAMKNFKV